MFSLYLILLLSLLSKGHTQLTDVSTSEVTAGNPPAAPSPNNEAKDASPNEVSEATKDAISPDATTTVDFSTFDVPNNEAKQAEDASQNEVSKANMDAILSQISMANIFNNEAMQSGSAAPSEVAEASLDPTSPTISIPNSEATDSTAPMLNNEPSSAETNLQTYTTTEEDRIAMEIISTFSNFLVAGVVLFKFGTCMLPHLSDLAIGAAKPMVSTVLLMPMQVAGAMLEFTLGPIIKFLVVVLTPVTLIMRLTLTPLFGELGHSMNYFLEPVISFIGVYLNKVLFPLKIVGELLETYWIKPVFGPLFDMIEVMLDPLAKLLAKLLNRLAPIIEIVEPLLEPLLSVTSSLAPTLRSLPGASMLLKVITILMSNAKVELSFLNRLLETFDPDNN